MEPQGKGGEGGWVKPKKKREESIGKVGKAKRQHRY